MNKKSRDSVFAIVLILLGGYVLYEGLAIVNRASRPPYNIADFGISPGMLPVVLGAALVFFSLLLLGNTLRGEHRPVSTLVSHLKTTSTRFGRALGEVDIRSMLISVGIMMIYTFFILGNVPFWLGALIFLVCLMLFIRAAKMWVILASSIASIAAIVLLFENFFKTTLP